MFLYVASPWVEKALTMYSSVHRRRVLLNILIRADEPALSDGHGTVVELPGCVSKERILAALAKYFRRRRQLYIDYIA